MELAVRLRTALSAKPDADLKSVRCRHSLKTKLIYDKGRAVEGDCDAGELILLIPQWCAERNGVQCSKR